MQYYDVITPHYDAGFGLAAASQCFLGLMAGAIRDASGELVALPGDDAHHLLGRKVSLDPHYPGSQEARRSLRYDMLGAEINHNPSLHISGKSNPAALAAHPLKG